MHCVWLHAFGATFLNATLEPIPVIGMVKFGIIFSLGTDIESRVIFFNITRDSMSVPRGKEPEFNRFRLLG